MDQKHEINKWKNKQYIEACSNGLDELQPRVLGILSIGNTNCDTPGVNHLQLRLNTGLP